jgi:hypothetical protein
MLVIDQREPKESSKRAVFENYVIDQRGDELFRVVMVTIARMLHPNN